MNNVLIWVSAGLWIVVFICSFLPYWWRREWRFVVVPGVLAMTAVAQVLKLETLRVALEPSAVLSVVVTDLLAALAVAGYTVCLSRLAKDQNRTEQIAREEQRARQEADAEKRLAAAVLERVNDSFFSLDREWRFTFISREGARAIREKPELLLGRTIWESFPGTVNSAFESAYRKAMETQQPVTIEANYGPWDRWFETRIYPSAEGLTVFFHDISDRKIRESKLQSAKIQLDVAVAAANIGVWDWDLQHSIVTFSPAWKAQLGYEPDEIEDSYDQWQSRIHPDDRERILAQLNDYIQNSTSEFENEARLRHKNGEYRWILTRGELERDENGKPVRMRGCHIDITERKKVEEQLKKTQRELRALGAHLESVREHESARIARELHDELGQSLTALKLDLKWIAERVPACNGSADSLAARVAQAIELTNETIKQVRRICLELRPALLDQLGLPTAIEWQARDFETRTGVPVDVSVAQELAQLDPGVATALFRISQEALTNVARHANASHVDISLVKRENCAELCIRDNGQGLACRAQQSGAGFGMLGIRERAMAVGGEMEVLSNPGEGVTLCVSIPLQPKVQRDSAGAEPLGSLPKDSTFVYTR